MGSQQHSAGLKAHESRALEALAARTRADDLALVDREAVESDGRTVYRYRAVRKSDGNGPQYTVVLDTQGKELHGHRLAAVESGGTATTVNAEGGTVAADAAVTISPNVNNLVLSPGQTFTEVITVFIPANTTAAKADIYFLADTTGSMSGPIGAVAAGANQILNDLAALGIDLAYGVGNYKDFPPVANPAAFQHQLSLTTNTAAVSAAINNWTSMVSGGGDTPEGQFFALDQLAIPPNAPPIGWRPGAERIIVWFGDAPAHDPVCAAISGLSYDITETLVTSKLTVQNIAVLAISVTTPGLDDNPVPLSFSYNSICGAPGGSAGQASRIAAATGGSFSTGVNSAAIVSTITAMVTAAVTTINNVSLVPTGGTASFITSISPAGGYGPLSSDVDHTLRFEVTFTGQPCASFTQVFSGTLDVVADGGVIAQKAVTITVPPCSGKRHVYSVKFVCGTQRDGDCPVQPGQYSTDVNIHNLSDQEARLEKEFIPLVLDGEPLGREPKASGPHARDFIVLPPRSATMDDCCRIQELLGTDPGRLTVGFLQITSDIELNVVAVYTAAGLNFGGPVSIDVEQVEARLI